MSDTSCDHLDKITDAEKCYHLIVAYFVIGIGENAPKKKASLAHCRLCQKNNRRLHACLECSFFGCFDCENGNKSHMEEHYLEARHCFAVNINHGCIYCFECGDYVYNEAFEDIFKEYKLEAVKFFGYRPYMPWKPKAKEITELKGKIKKIADDSYIGLRGIINIGNSCYINVIIQVFIHNPILRDYFLADQHKCFLEKNCLTCEMFVLFQEFYSGIKASYDPSRRFFSALQYLCTSDLGVDQQDAHELLQIILTGLHNSCEETHSKNIPRNTLDARSYNIDNCNCLIHRTFYGVSQESRECLECKALLDLPLEHFMDIPLYLKDDKDSLVELLNRKYLQSQLLNDHKCSKCKQTNVVHLRQKIIKLPSVICFLLNSYNVEGKEVWKKNTVFEFEEWIDMSSYLTSKDKLPIENRYQLYAVIFHNSHKGNVKGGHYSVFVRQRLNKWYECNDHLVHQQTLKNVLECEPVILFYCKPL